MKIHRIIPEVWTCEGWPPMLVCAFNYWKGDIVKGAKNSNTVESITHPVAIQLTTPPKLLFGFHGGDDSKLEVWTRHQPEKIGIPPRAAELALAEAFRCITASQDPFSRVITAEVKLAKARERNSTILRNVLVWLRWGSWKARGFTREQARAEIVAHGFFLSEKAFAHVLENAGMSL